MIEEKTVIILGAGSGKPFGLPTGEDLSREISFDFRDHFIEFMDKFHGEDYVYRDKILLDSQKLVYSFSRSTLTIDSFLSINPALKEIGKLAILHRIMLSENKSKLPWENRKNSPDWFLPLFRTMIADISNETGITRFGNNKVSFITFNYDRLLEYVLFENLRNSYPEASRSDIIEQLIQIPMVHVYGKISDLPWQSQNGYDYKHIFDFNTLFKMSENIFTIDEQKFTETIKYTHELIEKANRIFFLGFGYIPENLKNLELPNILQSKHIVIGTAYKASEKKINDLKEIFITTNRGSKPGGVDPGNAHILNLDCNDLLIDWL